MGMTLVNLRVSGKVPFWIDLLTNMLTGVEILLLICLNVSAYLHLSCPVLCFGLSSFLVFF